MQVHPDNCDPSSGQTGSPEVARSIMRDCEKDAFCTRLVGKAQSVFGVAETNGESSRKFFADICSGSGGVARALRNNKFQCLEFEKKHGHNGDVTRQAVLQMIELSAALGLLLGVMLAPPCTTCSQAMFWSGLLRSKTHPWGRPGLSHQRQRKVKEANKVLRAVIRIIRICERFRIPWILENPAQSTLWWIPFFSSLLSRTHVPRTVADFCRFGMRWRKRTCFLSGHVADIDLCRLRKRC